MFIAFRNIKNMVFAPKEFEKCTFQTGHVRPFPRACKPDISSHVYRIDLKFREKLEKGRILKHEHSFLKNSIWVALESIFWSY